MKFRHEVFPLEAQHVCAREMQTVLVDYLTGKYQALYFAMGDLISRLCLQNQVTLEGREAIRLNNSLSFLIDRWQEGLVDGGRPTEQEMQSIIKQMLPVVVQAILPDAIGEEEANQ
jgi:hypothetical protein